MGLRAGHDLATEQEEGACTPKARPLEASPTTAQLGKATRVFHLESPNQGKEDVSSFCPGQLGFEVALLSCRWPREMAPGTYVPA